MTDQKGRKHAVVLSGGGAYGAFEVGVMKALFHGLCSATHHQPLHPDIFTGTSVGAYNAAVMASRPGCDAISAVAHLEDIWRNRVADRTGQCGNGVFRFRGGLSDVLDPECLTQHPLEAVSKLTRDGAYLARDFFRRGAHFFQTSGKLEHRTLEFFNLSSFISAEPLRRLIADTISIKDLMVSEKEVRVVATNWETGEAAIFKKEHFSDETGCGAILASAAIPGFFPPVEISGTCYVDGGVVMNTPLMPAIEAGADVVHMIYLDPDIKNIPLARLESTLDTLDRMMTIQFALNINADIEKADTINRGLDVIDRLGREDPPGGKDAQAFIQAAERIQRHLKAGKPYKKIEIHRYHPREDLGGVLGILKFGRDHIEDLIARGVQDAVEHDCAVCGCCIG